MTPVAHTCLLFQPRPSNVLTKSLPPPLQHKETSCVHTPPQPRPAALLVRPPPSIPTIPSPTPLSPLWKRLFQLQVFAAPGRPPSHLARRYRRYRVAPVGVIPERASIAPHVCRGNAVSARPSCHLPEESRRGCFVSLASVVAVARGR